MNRMILNVGAVACLAGAWGRRILSGEEQSKPEESPVDFNVGGAVPSGEQKQDQRVAAGDSASHIEV